jgi:hypothetical protein
LSTNTAGVSRRMSCTETTVLLFRSGICTVRRSTRSPRLDTRRASTGDLLIPGLTLEDFLTFPLADPCALCRCWLDRGPTYCTWSWEVELGTDTTWESREPLRPPGNRLRSGYQRLLEGICIPRTSYRSDGRCYPPLPYAMLRRKQNQPTSLHFLRLQGQGQNIQSSVICA